MTMADPFASAPAAPAPAPVQDEAQQQPVQQSSPWDNPPPEAAKPAPAPRPIVAGGGDGKVVLTFKGGTGFDAPWIVVHASDLDEAASYVGENAAKFMELMTRVQNAGKHFAGMGGGSAPANNGGGGQQQRAPQNGQPPQSQQAPNGEKRFCAHGEMRFKSDVSKAGKPYKGFFCTERDRNSQCEAQFLR
ncbi:ribonucleoside reductase class II [Mycobacterium phage MyraDee]|uniref:Uncharacterized protein n=1 Tax=Mycobacterium phage MyraDee TaxID=2024303 RepID=A0A222YXZ3_9CAUD|nr:ribonucleoside reductase class II [Mycobacterium phage MyraDee]ASR77151.1 hypothetical protein SEA_MYRADEE_43 [Mycobacterium phage MyraDee]